MDGDFSLFFLWCGLLAFGSTLFVFPLRALLAFDIALAVFGPAVTTLLVAFQSLIVGTNRMVPCTPGGPTGHGI